MTSHWRYSLSYVTWRKERFHLPCPSWHSPQNIRGIGTYHYLSIEARCTPWLDIEEDFGDKIKQPIVPRIRHAREIYLDVIMPLQIIFGRGKGDTPSCASANLLSIP